MPPLRWCSKFPLQAFPFRPREPGLPLQAAPQWKPKPRPTFSPVDRSVPSAASLSRSGAPIRPALPLHGLDLAIWVHATMLSTPPTCLASARLLYVRARPVQKPLAFRIPSRVHFLFGKVMAGLEKVSIFLPTGATEVDGPGLCFA